MLCAMSAFASWFAWRFHVMGDDFNAGVVCAMAAIGICMAISDMQTDARMAWYEQRACEDLGGWDVYDV